MGSDQFFLRYWGVRGSIPAPGPDTVRYGGNTTCIEVQAGDRLLCIDGGTGVRLYGQDLMKRLPVQVTFLMTHLHWDHVQGFPFFTPFLVPGNHFKIYSGHHNGGNIHGVLKQLMAQPAFPISMDAFQSEVGFSFIEPGDRIEMGDLKIDTMLLRHPGGVLGYRFEYRGKVFVHASDWEHPDEGMDEEFIEFARDADILSVDATYTNEEYEGRCGPSRRGWGHASHEAAIAHADAAGVKRTVMCHHEQTRTDGGLDDIAARLFVGRSDLEFALEGRRIDLL
ncbi:MAG TPA: MBL fold metallo-hydrolase [Myxococcales bacterium]|nr:MBL fold metallo-hydrolase [Myxococcales bacterium]HAN32836.1 MBL fold metallo-hydrolase [Myxococcales bacterium]